MELKICNYFSTFYYLCTINIFQGRIEKVGSFSDFTEKHLKIIRQEVEEEKETKKIENMKTASSKDLTFQSANSLEVSNLLISNKKIYLYGVVSL